MAPAENPVPADADDWRSDDAGDLGSGSLFEPIDDAPDSEPRDWEGGPPTEATPVIGAGSAFGGSHLDELRRAVSEEADDAEADAAMAAFFDQDTEEDRARRFGRRR